MKPKIHELKTHPEYFQAILEGRKTFEARRNDRDFKEGDVLILKEFTPNKCCGGTGRKWDNGDKTECGCNLGIYSGNRIEVEVSYVLQDEAFGVQKGFCVMGIKV